jgi:hypothetical protein
MTLRHLVAVLGDQLDANSAALDGFDAEQDAILQMEVREEASCPTASSPARVLLCRDAAFPRRAARRGTSR